MIIDLSFRASHYHSERCEESKSTIIRLGDVLERQVKCKGMAERRPKLTLRQVVEELL